ncbi:MAG TPA: hypothetical protein VK915_03655 [Gaiellaceae bacterium]|nr:hypothetical protein [Gaiellaceae bacterium]
MSVLEPIGAVRAEYRHADKEIRPSESLLLDEALLKWYDVASGDAPVPGAVRALARRSLRAAAKAGAIELRGELGFVVLHRCGESFYFLLVCTWRNDNELWETVWAKDGEEDPDFRPWPVEGTHRPTFCVWELAAVCHERQAWARYLRSARDEPAKLAYLRDAYAGPC